MTDAAMAWTPALLIARLHEAREGDVWRLNQEALSCLGFEVAQHKRGGRWKPDPSKAWQARPLVLKDVDDAMRVARLKRMLIRSMSWEGSAWRVVVIGPRLPSNDAATAEHPELAAAIVMAMLLHVRWGTA